MPLILQTPADSITDALRTASRRGILPTWLDSAGLAELETAIKERAVFSARTTNAFYLEALKGRIERLLADGYEGDQAKLRRELKGLLQALGYDPETGFPGDARLGIPAARAGSLQDLSSDRRINLILDTQMEILAGRGQLQRGLEPEAVDLFPAWELVRVKTARVPRDWFKRFTQAGGLLLEDDEGRKRIIAHKRDDVWSVLGDQDMFRDALGVAHPPFAFSSGMAWAAVEAAEWESLLRRNNRTAARATTAVPDAEIRALPAAQVSTDGLSASAAERLAAKLRNVEASKGRLVLKSVIGNAPPPPSRSRMNALLDMAVTMTWLDHSI
jgi:hypothetical protein